MSVRRFRLWPASTLEHVIARIAVPWQVWQRDWGIDCAIESVPIARAVQFDSLNGDIGWRRCVRVASGMIWLGWNANMENALSAALYPHDAAAASAGQSIAASAGAASLAALLITIAETLAASDAGITYAAPLDQLLSPGSGALLMKSAFGKGRLVILLDDQAVSALAPTMAVPPLSTLSRIAPEAILGDCSIPLQVSTGMTKLSLGDIVGLAVGDVIKFDAPLDQPLQLQGPSGASVCGARLLRDGEQCIFAITRDTTTKKTSI